MCCSLPVCQFPVPSCSAPGKATDEGYVSRVVVCDFVNKSIAPSASRYFTIVTKIVYVENIF